jgi:multimeric flavodoxin WrbA
LKPIKCLGIGCSPRRGGNTDILLGRAMEGARDCGAEVETLYLRDFEFGPCVGCDGCRKDGQCVIKDDMQDIYVKLLAADRVILAAPIFSMGINAQAKALIDRAQRFWSTIYVLKRPVIEDKENRPGRKGLFISAAGTDLPGVFSGAQRTVKYYFKMLEMEYAGEHLFTLVDDKGDILKHPDYLSEVYEAGKQLVSSK